MSLFEGPSFPTGISACALNSAYEDLLHIHLKKKMAGKNINGPFPIVFLGFISPYNFGCFPPPIPPPIAYCDIRTLLFP